jgi:hypothetical protein
LAEAIIYLLQSKTMRMNMGERASEKLQKNYSVEMQAKKMESIYEALLN